MPPDPEVTAQAAGFTSSNFSLQRLPARNPISEVSGIFELLGAFGLLWQPTRDSVVAKRINRALAHTSRLK